MGHEVKISEYCESCAFLCKTDKEYCPNKLSPYEVQKRFELMQAARMRDLYNQIKNKDK